MSPDLIRVLLPRGGYILSFLTACFDESGTDGAAPRFWLAGYIFEAKRGADFDAQWMAACNSIGLDYWHMTDSQVSKKGVCLSKDYKGKSTEEVARAARLCVSAIQEHASCGLILSLASADKGVIPEISSQFKITPYGFLCWNAMLAVQHWMEENDIARDIAYLFESGCDGYAELNDFMHGMLREHRNSPLKSRLSYRSHTFELGEKSSQLQAADMLAWHAQKQFKRGDRPIRPDYQAILTVPTTEYHFRRETLLSLRDKFGGL